MARSVNVIGTSVTVYPPWIARHARSIWKQYPAESIAAKSKLPGLRGGSAEAGGDVADLGPEGQAGVGVGAAREQFAPLGPVHRRTAGYVAGPDRQVGASIDRVEEPVQLLWRVRAVGIHLDEHRVVTGQSQVKPAR